jgi:hypothetical protein
MVRSQPHVRKKAFQMLCLRDKDKVPQIESSSACKRNRELDGPA